MDISQLCHEATINLLPKPKTLQGKKLQTKISREHRHKSSEQNFSKFNPAKKNLKKLHIYHDQMGLISGMES